MASSRISLSSTRTDDTHDSDISSSIRRGSIKVGTLGEGGSGSYAISTIVNLPTGRSPLANLGTSLSSSIPPSFKPPPFSSFVPSSSASQPTTLAPSNKRSAPPPLQLSEPPKVGKQDFERYLGEIGGEWGRWERNLKLGREGTANLAVAEETDAEGSEDVQRTPRIGSTGSVIEDGKKRQLPKLNSVPHVFFNDGFTLANPTTFDIVTERLPGPRRPASPTSPTTPYTARPFQEPQSPLSIPDLATDQILQEKLSHYLDVVELHLVDEISRRSASFFSALGNLQALHAQSASCLSQVTALNQELVAVDQEVAKKGLEVVRMGVRRKNMELVEKTLGRVREVWGTVKGAEELIAGGEWEEGLEMVEELQKLWDEDDPTVPTSASTVASGKLEVDHTQSPPPPPRLRLRKLKALSSLPTRLSSLRTNISKTLEAELLSILLHELRAQIEIFVSGDGKGWERPDKPSHLEESIPSEARNTARSSVEERVRGLVSGLVRAGGLERAVLSWREGVLKEIRGLVKAGLPVGGTEEEIDDGLAAAVSTPPGSVGGKLVGLGLVAGDGVGHKKGQASISEKTANLSRNLKALSHNDFLAIAKSTYSHLLGCIEVVDVHSKALLSIAEEETRKVQERRKPDVAINGDVEDVDATITADMVNGDELLKSPSVESPNGIWLSTELVDEVPLVELEPLASDLADLVGAAAELANTRFSKVVGVRAEIHSALSLEEFVAFFDCTWSFVVACEIVARRMIVGLRGVVVGQAKSFLQSFHQRRITDSARLVEEELWSQVEVQAEAQKTVDLVIASAVEDPKELVIGKEQAGEVGGKTNGVKKAARQVDIEGSMFYAVAAVLKTLATLADYLKVVVNCTMLTTDAMGKIVEFLKAFNSRTCQVVLGAGAMRSAGLKNITAKHLALASQALSIMINLIPYIRECLRRHLNPKQAVMLIDFDKLKRDYQEHQNEIHSKLVAIMGDRLVIHAKALSQIEWEKKTDVKAGGANPYMESLVKEVATLHRVLSRYLQPSTLEIIMMQVFSSINSRLAEEYSSIELKTEDAKQRLLGDARYLKAKLGELGGMERTPPGGELEKLVEGKPLPKSATPRVGLLSRMTSSKSTTPTPTPPPTAASEAATPSLDTPTDNAEVAVPPPDPKATASSDSDIPVTSPTEMEPTHLVASAEAANGVAVENESSPSVADDTDEHIDSTDSPAPRENGQQTTDQAEASPTKEVDSPPSAEAASEPAPTTPLTADIPLTPAPVAPAKDLAPSVPLDPLPVPEAEVGPPPPPKLSIGARLAALAASRRSSVPVVPPPSATSTEPPNILPEVSSPVAEPSSALTSNGAQAPSDLPSPPTTATMVAAPTQNPAPVSSPPTSVAPPRQSLKERLAAIAARSARATPTNSREASLEESAPVIFSSSRQETPDSMLEEKPLRLSLETGSLTPVASGVNGQTPSDSVPSIQLEMSKAPDTVPEPASIPPSPQLGLGSPSTFSAQQQQYHLQSPHGTPMSSPVAHRRPSSPGPEVSPIADIPLPESPAPSLESPTYAVYKRRGSSTPRSSSEGKMASPPAQTLSPLTLRKHSWGRDDGWGESGSG